MELLTKGVEELTCYVDYYLTRAFDFKLREKVTISAYTLWQMSFIVSKEKLWEGSTRSECCFMPYLVGLQGYLRFLSSFFE